jgi:hypothetical protein
MAENALIYSRSFTDLSAVEGLLSRPVVDSELTLHTTLGGSARLSVLEFPLYLDF